MLHALAAGADWIWLADDDGRPQDRDVLATLLACADTHALAEVSPMVCNLDDPDRLAFPLRRGLVWRRLVSELRTDGDAGPSAAAGYRVAVQRGTVPRVDGRGRRCAGSSTVRPRRRGGAAPQAGPLGPAVRNLFGRNLSAPVWDGRVQADPRRPDAHPVPRQPDQTVLHLPQPRLSVVPARVCESCCRRSGCGSGGTSWCRSAIHAASPSGCGCDDRAGARGSRSHDVHRCCRSVEDDVARLA